MDRSEAKKFKERWQRINSLTMAEQRRLSPEIKLQQSTELLRLAKRLGWELQRSAAEIQSIRRRWSTLRTRVHDGPS